jgi:hypothetical protein
MTTQEFLLAFVAVFGGLGIGALAIVLGIRHDWRKRELEHVERMKAFELGRTLPQDEPWLSPTKIGAFLTTIVPIGVFIIARLTTESAGYQETIWATAMVVGLAGVICGTVLVATAGKKRAGSPTSTGTKPYVDEDAYDVVSSRG